MQGRYGHKFLQCKSILFMPLFFNHIKHWIVVWLVYLFVVFVLRKKCDPYDMSCIKYFSICAWMVVSSYYSMILLVLFSFNIVEKIIHGCQLESLRVLYNFSKILCKRTNIRNIISHCYDLNVTYILHGCILEYQRWRVIFDISSSPIERHHIYNPSHVIDIYMNQQQWPRCISFSC